MIKNGFIKVCCISPKLNIGMPLINAKEIVNAINNSEATINLFPELVTTGYSCGDLFFNETLLKENEEAISYIVSNNKENSIAVIGAPLLQEGVLYNCAVVILGKKIIGVVPKMVLPNYMEFNEKRWFKEGSQSNLTHINISGVNYPFGHLIFKDYKNNLNIGIEICEDMWAIIPPSTYLALLGSNLILNLSASPEYLDKDLIRTNCVLDNSRRNNCAYVYASSGVSESSSESVFSAHNIVGVLGSEVKNDLSFAYDTHFTYADIDLNMVNHAKLGATKQNIQSPVEFKEILFELKETEYEFEDDINQLPFVPTNGIDKNFYKVSNILQNALARRLLQTRSKTLIIGVSGGLDSTLALLIAHATFKMMGKDPKDIIGVTMPGLGTSNRTKNNAILMMEKLGISMKNIDISQEVLNHFKLIDHDPESLDITYENTQARYRTFILMNLANKHNGIVLGTGDMSELALGWCTYNGDQMSMYGINAGMPKTFIRYMTKAYATIMYQDLYDVLVDVIETPISPELKKGQVTEDNVGKYEINDFILHRFLYAGDSKETTIWLLQKAFNLSEDTAAEYVKNFYFRFFTQQFKRSAMPDGPKVFNVSLSKAGYNIPSDLGRR